MAREENQHPRRDRDQPGPGGDRVERAVGLVAELRDGARAEAMGRARQLRAIGELFSHTLDTAQAVVQDQKRRLDGDPGHGRKDGSGRVFHGVHGLNVPIRVLRENALQETVAEVEVALLIPRGAAQQLVHEAIIVTEHLPEILRGLGSGEMSWAQARVILRHWSSISCDPAARMPAITPAGRNLDEAGHPEKPSSPELAGADAAEGADALVSAAGLLVQELVERAEFCSPGQLNDYGHRRRKELGVAAAQRAHRNARLERNVWVTAEEDGMAHLHAVLEAQKAIAVCDRIDRLARHQNPGQDPALRSGRQPDQDLGDDGRADSVDRRSIAQRRADVLTDLLLDAEPPADSGLQRGVRGQVTLLVPASMLVDADPDLPPLNDPGPPGNPHIPKNPNVPKGPKPSRAVTGSSTQPSTRISARDRGQSPSHKTRDSGPLNGSPDTEPVAAGPVAGPARTGPSTAELLGYGPVPAQIAVQIAANAGCWRRILTDPGTGVVTQYGRETYAVPAGLRRLLEVRDETCRFPGCRRSATACELDHTTAWEHGGCTDAGNMAHLCRAHHRTKHHPGTFGTWTVTQRTGAEVSEAPEDGARGRIAAGAADEAPLEAALVDTAEAGMRARTADAASTSASAGFLRVESPLGTVRTTAAGYRGWRTILENADLAEPLRSDPPRRAAPSPSQASWPSSPAVPDDQPPPF